MSKSERERLREQLLKRQQESYDRKDGEVGTKYLISNLPVPMWKCGVTKDEPHIIDIIPFIAGNKFPIQKDPVKKGDPEYHVEVFVHTNIGPNKDMIVCPAKNYKKPCPICEDIDAQLENGKEYDDLKTIWAKRRCLYLIVEMDGGKEEKKGLQIWEVSHKYSEKLIQSAAKAPRGGGLIPFADPDTGTSIAFEVLNDTYRTIQGHKLVKRDYVVSDDLIDQAKKIHLDELMVEMSYDEINRLYSASEEKGEEIEEYNKPEEEPSTRSERRTRRSKSCPHVDDGWGKMIDKLEECEECNLYDDCGAEADRLEAEEKERKKREAEEKKSEQTTRRRRRPASEDDDIPF